MHLKTAAALALTAVKSEDQRELAKLVDSARTSFNDAPRMAWGGARLLYPSRPPLGSPCFSACRFEQAHLCKAGDSWVGGAGVCTAWHSTQSHGGRHCQSRACSFDAGGLQSFARW